MGILTNLVNSELDKKKEERLMHLKAYSSILADDNQSSETRQAAWDALTKQAPGKGKQLLEIFKPMMLGAGKAAKAIHVPGGEKLEALGQKTSDQPDANPLRPKFLSHEDNEKQWLADQKAETDQKNAQQLDLYTKEKEADQRVTMISRAQNRQSDQQDIQELMKRPNIDEVTRQTLIGDITKRQPTWEPMVMVSPDGKTAIPISFDKANMKAISPQGQPVAVPPGWSPMTRSDHDKESKKTNYSQAVNDEIEFQKSQGKPDEEATRLALADEHNRRETKDTTDEFKLGKAKADKAAALAPSTSKPGSMKSSALFSLLTGDNPTFGLGKSGQRDAYNAERSKLIEEIGPEKLAMMKASYKAGSAELSQLMKSTGMLDAVESAFKYDIKNALDASKEVDRTAARRYNTWQQFAAADITDDPKLAAFQVAAQTAANQYARIMVSAGRGSVTSDQARQHAEKLLNTAMASGSFEAALSQMNKEATNMTAGLNEATQHAQDNLGRLGQPLPSAGSGGGPKKLTSTADYDALPKGAKYIDSDGNTYTKK